MNENENETSTMTLRPCDELKQPYKIELAHPIIDLTC